ncbi:hypothetical protein D3C76_1576080 [compost metagenome]
MRSRLAGASLDLFSSIVGLVLGQGVGVDHLQVVRLGAVDLADGVHQVNAIVFSANNQAHEHAFKQFIELGVR